MLWSVVCPQQVKHGEPADRCFSQQGQRSHRVKLGSHGQVEVRGGAFLPCGTKIIALFTCALELSAHSGCSGMGS